MKEEMGMMEEKKKMRTMYFQNLEMKEYVKKGTLYTARKTWEVRSHMLDLAGNYPGHKKYEQSDWKTGKVSSMQPTSAKVSRTSHTVRRV